MSWPTVPQWIEEIARTSYAVSTKALPPIIDRDPGDENDHAQ